jgi:O-succinylbenzoic acid--CoA ligase
MRQFRDEARRDPEFAAVRGGVSMPRSLVVVPDDPGVMLGALREALAGGPAILPLADDAPREGLPGEVAQNVALVVQTSGSTGAPKRVALSADAVLASAAAADSMLGGPGQWLLALPAHYIAGINVLVRSIAAGTEPVLLDRFDPHAFAEAAAGLAHPVRYTSLVPAQLARLIDTPEALASLRRFGRILVGGQATPPALLDRARELGLAVTRTYGSSETSGGCVYDGVPVGSTRVRIVDGQIELGGPMLAEGYLGDEARTAAAFRSDAEGRWYRTADAGELVDGILRVTGRLDDTIVSGGEKVSLGAVERLVRTLPGLADAVVVSRVDARWGEVPVVVTTAEASLEAVRTAVGSGLGPAARPAALVVVASIPHSSTGKPDRAALAELVSRTP